MLVILSIKMIAQKVFNKFRKKCVALHLDSTCFVLNSIPLKVNNALRVNWLGGYANYLLTWPQDVARQESSAPKGNQ